MKDLLIDLATGFFHGLQYISNDIVLTGSILSAFIIGFITLIITTK